MNQADKYTWEKEDIIFNNPCCRCGFCCLSEICPVGQTFYGIEKEDPCPALEFNGTEAICNLSKVLSKDILGIGKGCCIKARVFKNGVQYDFSQLPENLKKITVTHLRKEKMG